MNFLSEHMKETADRIDGFLTGRLIVDLEKQTVQLGVDVDGKTDYLTLTDLDQIEIRNIDEYMPVTIKQTLETMAAGTEDWPLYAGLYTRVKVHKGEKLVAQLSDEVTTATTETDLSTFDTSFRAHCKHDSNFLVEVDSNHLSLVDAQRFYQDQVRREEGRFINIELSQEGENFIDVAVTLSVEDAEKLALHILGLCQAIKGVIV